MLASADQVVFISAAVAEHFSRVPFKCRPRLIFNGVDTDTFELPPAGFDSGPGKDVTGSAGRWTSRRVRVVASLRRRACASSSGWRAAAPI